MPTAHTGLIYAATRRTTTCVGRTCGAVIVKAQLVASGKTMPFDPPLPALESRQREDGVVIDLVDLGASHFATCPDSEDFKRRRRRP
jgi:hypothetical protein